MSDPGQLDVELLKKEIERITAERENLAPHIQAAWDDFASLCTRISRLEDELEAKSRIMYSDMGNYEKAARIISGVKPVYKPEWMDDVLAAYEREVRARAAKGKR